MRENEKITTLSDPELERGFIAAMCVDDSANVALPSLLPLMSEDDFTDTAHRDAWRVIRHIGERGGVVTMVNVYAEAATLGVKLDITRYVQQHSTMADALSVGRALHAIGERRRLAERVQGVFLGLLYDIEQPTEHFIREIDDMATAANKRVESDAETFGEVYEELLRVTQDKANGKIPAGIKSGFDLIDRKGGLERGELMVIAGRNSNGKTAFALCVALNAASAGARVAVFSLEMTNLQLVTRLSSILSGVNSESIKRGSLSEDEWTGLMSVSPGYAIYFDKRRSTDADTLIAGIKRLHAIYGVEVVVIDYLQLLRSRERERLQQMGSIAHRLEALSKQLGICIILLSQLRRNEPRDTEPKLEEIKESGDIADAADSIYMVYRPERHGADVRYGGKWATYPTAGTALLMCKKNRQGALGGEQLLGFDCTTTRFYETEFSPVYCPPAGDIADELGF